MSIVHYEDVERNVLSVVFQVLYDYRVQASKIFQEEMDQPQDIAEDITREAIAEMGLSGIKERLYGKVDVKKAIYQPVDKVQKNLNNAFRVGFWRLNCSK